MDVARCMPEDAATEQPVPQVIVVVVIVVVTAAAVVHRQEG
jgi:hypothetical protein